MTEAQRPGEMDLRDELASLRRAVIHLQSSLIDTNTRLFNLYELIQELKTK